ncbi:MAG: DnaJ domain-containing protein, partial [Desulfobacterales bacterium]
FATQFYSQFRFQPRILEFMIEILLRVSIADGQMSTNEEQLIHSAVRIFNLNDEQYQTIKSKYVQISEKYYAVLKCNPNDSDEDIKKQYRKLVRDFHPDTIASKGLPDEFNQFAHDKFREIQQAYDEIKKERNIA